MGTIRKINENPDDSRNLDIFLYLKKHYLDNKKQLVEILLQKKEHTVIVEQNEELRCTLLQTVNNPYGKEHHILLELNDNRYGCNIEHRYSPYQEAWMLNPTSRRVNNMKHGFSLNDYQKSPSTIKEPNRDIEEKLRQNLSLVHGMK